MKHFYLKSKLFLCVLIALLGTQLQAQNTGNVFFDFSSNDLTYWDIDNSTASPDLEIDQNIGHLTVNTSDQGAGTYRGDLRYNMNPSLDAAAFLTINPLEDSLLSIKFAGKRPSSDGGTLQLFFEMDASTLRSEGTGVQPTATLTTDGGNEVIYYDLTTLAATSGSSWTDLITAAQVGVDGGDPVTDYDIQIRRFRFKNLTLLPEDSIFHIDWIGTFASVDQLTTFMNEADDTAGIGDLDDNGSLSADYTATHSFYASDLTIGTGATLTVAAGSTASITGDLTGSGDLMVESGASLLTYDGNTIAPVTIERNTRYSNGSYSFVGSPVTQHASITGSDLGGLSWWYDETEAYSAVGGDRWKDASTEELIPGVGYAQAFKKTVTFTGVPNAGTVTVSGLSNTAADANIEQHGWALLSNPYAAPISVTTFLDANTNIDGFVAIWDDGGSGAGTASNSDYLTVNGAGAVNGATGSNDYTGSNGDIYNGNILSMQGFFARISAESANASVMFTEAMRNGGANENVDEAYFRKNTSDPVNVKLALSAVDLYNETLVSFRDDASLDIDRSFDAIKLIGNQNLQFYSFINDNKYAIQGLPKNSGTTTDLGFNLGVSSQLTLSVVELSDLEENMTITLTDKETGVVYDLSTTDQIEISASEGLNQNRFVVSYTSIKDVLSNNTESIEDPNYRFINDELIINVNNNDFIKGYVVYDLVGKIISLKSSLGDTTQELNIPINRNGVQVVKVVTSQGSFIKKFSF